MPTSPSAPAPREPVTLSDGSVWLFAHGYWSRFQKATIGPDAWVSDVLPDHLTASDHRKIADVLDPPRPLPDRMALRSTLIKLFRAFETRRVPLDLPGCPDPLGYDDVADWFLAAIFPAQSSAPPREAVRLGTAMCRAYSDALASGCDANGAFDAMTDLLKTATESAAPSEGDWDGLTDEAWCASRDIPVAWTQRNDEGWRRLRAKLPTIIDGRAYRKTVCLPRSVTVPRLRETVTLLERYAPAGEAETSAVVALGDLIRWIETDGEYPQYLAASVPVDRARDREALSIDNVLFQLEGAMDACCDQPLRADRMTLTRTWRDILEEFASVPSVTEADDTDGMLWVQMPRGSLEASLEDAKRILARGTWKGDAIDQVLWQGHVDRLTAALYPSIDFRATGDAVRTAPTEEKRND